MSETMPHAGESFALFEAGSYNGYYSFWSPR
jgi:hypothetical protein